MEMRNFTAGKNDDNRRVDKVLRIFLPETSLTDIYKSLRKGMIKVNGKKVENNYRLQQGDVISVAEFLLQNQSSAKNESTTFKLPADIPNIIFENENIIIYDKPYDILVQGDSQSLDKITVEYFKSKNKENSLSFTPGPLHRLDRKTTGLIAFSKSINGARWFSENIKNHTIIKKYKTILEGKITEPEIWNDFIEKTEDNKKQFHTVKATAAETSNLSKNAYTEVTPLKTGQFNNKDITYAEILIKTGRMHQIRAQSALHNHPLLGDTVYGGTKLPDKITKKDFFLQAYKLIIPENPIGLPEEISIDLPEDFKNFLTQSCDMKISEL